MMVNKAEVQLFLIWGTARNRENSILEEIKKQFKILEIYEIEWSKENFKLNLVRFYCEKIRRKIKHTGTGKFLLVTVLDENPDYGYEKTLNEFEFVNRKTLSVKQKIRKITGKYNFHSTNDKTETNKNLSFLLNKSYDEYFEYAKNKTFDGKYIQIKSDPVGTNGWNNLDEIFKLLNSSCRYVILRGADNLFNGNIDVLTDNAEEFKILLNGQKAYHKNYMQHQKVNIGGKEIIFDIKNIGDGYYCEKWEEEMLERRFLTPQNFFVLSPKDFKYSLLYHIFFHKKEIPAKYNEFLSQISTHPTNLYIEMYNFLDENDYFVSVPCDKKVQFNADNLKRMKWFKLLNTKYDLKNIEEFKVNKKPSSGFSYFFIAELHGKKVFVKCGYGTYDAKKEFEVYEILHEQNPEYFPKAYMYRNLSDNRMFLCTEFIEGENLSKELIKSSTPEKREKMFNSLYEIAIILFNNKFIHRDLNKGNLLVTQDGTIKVIDFQHLIGVKFKENKENIIYPKKLRGTNKKLRPAPFVWDDMYSVYKMMKYFDKFEIKDYNKKLSEIKSKIGKQRYYFLDNKFPFISYFNFKYLIVYKLFNVIKFPFRSFM